MKSYGVLSAFYTLGLVVVVATCAGKNSGKLTRLNCPPKSASLTVKDEDQFNRDLISRLNASGVYEKIPKHLPGGYIDLYYYVKKGDPQGTPVVNWDLEDPNSIEKKNKRCTFFMSFSSEKTFDDLKLWTSAHCLAFSYLVETKLQMYSFGGYLEFPIKPKILDVVEKTRRATLDLNPVVRQKLLSTYTLHNQNTSTNLGIQRCTSLGKRPEFPEDSFYKLKNLNHSCFSMTDLSLFSHSFVGVELSEKQRAVLTSLQGKYWAIHKAAKEVLDNNAALNGFDTLFTSGQEFYQKVKELESTIKFSEWMDKCQSGTLSECTTDVVNSTAWMALRQKLVTIFPEGAFMNLEGPDQISRRLAESIQSGKFGGSLLILAAALATAPEPGKTPKENLDNQFRRSSVVLDLIWSVISSVDLVQNLSDTSKGTDEKSRINRFFYYSFNSNLDFGSTKEGQSRLFYRWLPTMLSPSDSKGEVDQDQIFRGFDGKSTTQIHELWPKLAQKFRIKENMIITEPPSQLRHVKQQVGLGNASAAPNSLISLPGLAEVAKMMDTFKNRGKTDEANPVWNSRVVVVSTPPEDYSLQFERGDSGTVLSFLAFPMGALAAVKKADSDEWEETGGEGLRSVPLPQAGESEEDEKRRDPSQASQDSKSKDARKNSSGCG